jgi:hypothetical protein
MLFDLIKLPSPALLSSVQLFGNPGLEYQLVHLRGGASCPDCVDD